MQRWRIWDRVAQASVAGLAGAARPWFLGEKPGANAPVLPAVANFADAVREFRASDSDPDFVDSVCEIGGKSSIPAVPVVLVLLCAADPHRGRRSPELL